MADVETIKEFANLGFMRLERATSDLTEEQLDWQSCREANTIRWILTHLNSEFFGFIPKIVSGNKDLESELPEDYVGNMEYSLEKIMGDLEKGKIKLMGMLDDLDNEDLDEEMEWFFGKRTKGFYLMLAVSEIVHHEGQIAAILGVEKRMKGT
ncbi:hypothetical protein GF319_14655 [Candidatus Bathyarchaeota archaeon]|nr:hypothetical protein [Candidatus Bathyarchaeota archaeon]